jgi:hypothetical protein
MKHPSFIFHVTITNVLLSTTAALCHQITIFMKYAIQIITHVPTVELHHHINMPLHYSAYGTARHRNIYEPLYLLRLHIST